jgi:predicted DNA-binding transcriptional regulator AlpA
MKQSVKQNSSTKAAMPPINHSASDKALFFDIPGLAEALKCSPRHITNLRSRGEIPQPVKLGSRVVWPKQKIREWIEAGCPSLAV